MHQSTSSGDGYTNYVLDMTSQTWRSPSEVNRTAWQHRVNVVVPTTVTNNTALLFIDGGSNSSPNSLESELTLAAQLTGSVVVHLPTIPNQPLTFSDEGFPRTEDNLIAYTFDKFLTTGDPTWPALLPMVKSAVRAMDTAQTFVPTTGDGSLAIDDFIVAGASKRGWTTYLTGAVDNRVRAIAPAVFDALNLTDQIPHQKAAYEGVTQFITGGYSSTLAPYVAFDLPDRLLTPEGQQLINIVDPYAYRDRLTMPKMLLHAAGDEFFVSDSSQFYVHDLLGPTYMRYVPNAGHDLDLQALFDLLPIYNTLVDDNRSLPEYSWSVEDGGYAIRVETEDGPSLIEVNLWQASNPDSRDFRDGIVGPEWESTSLVPEEPGVYVGSVMPPDEGYTAFMVELVFSSGEVFPYRFTTEISVVGVPEPSTLVMGLLGLAMFVAIARRAKRN